MGEAASASGPDFSHGIKLSEIPDEGMISGRVGDQPVLLSRFDGQLFAIAASCTHYGGNLGEGVATGISVRCPLHHACFDLRTGAVLRAPALDPLERWQVDVEGNRAFVRHKIESHDRLSVCDEAIGKVVIVGGGAAGLACANALRHRGFAGKVTILSADADPPCDRPNLSKDFLSGSAPEEWLWLRSGDWYHQNDVDLRLSTKVTRIDPAARIAHAASGEQFPFDRLLIATGGEPNRLDLPGFDGPNVHTLRSVADSRTLAQCAEPGARAVIIGASFIALEAAAALRHRRVEVEIASVEEIPLEQVFGKDLGRELQALHERNGVRFHMSSVVTGFDGKRVELKSGLSIAADFVLVAIGVKPRTALAQEAGASVGNGVLVNAFLETSLPGIYAAGDIAAYPEPVSGKIARIEHWVVAERQGQLAAANILGERICFQAPPFFWTEQYGVSIRYVGHASNWEEVSIEGDLASGSLTARYFVEGTHRATATVGNDRKNLEDELDLEKSTVLYARSPNQPN